MSICCVNVLLVAALKWLCFPPGCFLLWLLFCSHFCVLVFAPELFSIWVSVCKSFKLSPPSPPSNHSCHPCRSRQMFDRSLVSAISVFKLVCSVLLWSLCNHCLCRCVHTLFSAHLYFNFFVLSFLGYLWYLYYLSFASYISFRPKQEIHILSFF